MSDRRIARALHSPIGPDAAGDALTGTLTRLGEIEPDPDLEPVDDRLKTGGDDEFDLAWPADVSQLAPGPNTADGGPTTPERHGMGFVRCGPYDANVDDPSGRQHCDEDLPVWRIDLGCMIGGGHG